MQPQRLYELCCETPPNLVTSPSYSFDVSGIWKQLSRVVLARGCGKALVTWAPLGATSALRPWQLTSPRVIDPREQGGEVTPCHWLSCSLEKLLVLVWPVLKGMVGKLPLRRGRTPKNFQAGPEATAVPENGNYRHGREILPSGGWLDWVEVVPAKLETDVILFPLGLRVSVAPAGPALYLHPLRPPRLHDAEGSCSG